MNYEVKGEARTRKVTPGEMALMNGAVALLSEINPVMPGDMVVTWGGDLTPTRRMTAQSAAMASTCGTLWRTCSDTQSPLISPSSWNSSERVRW